MLRLGLSGPTRVTLGLYHYRHRRVPDYSIPYDPRTGTPITETIGVSRRNFYGLVRRDSGDTEDYAATVKWEHDLANGFKVENLARYSRATVEQITTMPELKTADLAKGLVYRNLRASYQSTTVSPTAPTCAVHSTRGSGAIPSIWRGVRHQPAQSRPLQARNPRRRQSLLARDGRQQSRPVRLAPGSGSARGFPGNGAAQP